MYLPSVLAGFRPDLYPSSYAPWPGIKTTIIMITTTKTATSNNVGGRENDIDGDIDDNDNTAPPGRRERYDAPVQIGLAHKRARGGSPRQPRPDVAVALPSPTVSRGRHDGATRRRSPVDDGRTDGRNAASGSSFRQRRPRREPARRRTRRKTAQGRAEGADAIATAARVVCWPRYTIE